MGARDQALVPSGTVHLVGAGPGAPDLLTLRAARLLESADIVFHDALVHPETLALAVRARKVFVGKRGGLHAVSQRDLNAALVEAARTHRTVVRLKGGDPLVFGRAQEEIEALVAAGIAFELVPGVTAACAAAADLRISLTRRGVARSVVLVTPSVGDGEAGSDWASSVLAADTAALYMGAGDAARVAATLIGRGLDPATPVALVEDASLARSRHERGVLAGLASLASRRGNGPVLILIGAVFEQVSSPGSALETGERTVAHAPGLRGL
jgi:uroporphyrin-III C-methyltransferase